MEDELKDFAVREENSELQKVVNNYLQGRVVGLRMEVERLLDEVRTLRDKLDVPTVTEGADDDDSAE